MTVEAVELVRCGTVAEARATARDLLAAGQTPMVSREGDDHVVSVPPAEVVAARRALGLATPDAEDDVDGVPADVGAQGVPTAFGVAAARTQADGDDEIGDPGEDEGLDVNVKGYAAIALVDGEDEAAELAARLLDGGFGFDIGRADEEGFANPLMGPSQARVIRVIESDATRAIEVLGVTPPARARPPVVEGTSLGEAPRVKPRPETREIREYFGGRLRLSQRQAVTYLLLYLLALVLVPLAFFYGTRYFLDDGGTADIPSITSTSVP